jgi:hypothetical protein
LHTARLQRGRRELVGDEQVWEELERWGAATALVRFSGGGGSLGSIAVVSLEAGGDELARWESGSGELAEALAAPVWGRYALFRGHPRITGLLQWDVRERQVAVAGRRGDHAPDEVLSGARQLARAQVTPVNPSVQRDTSPGSSGSYGVAAERDTSRPVGGGAVLQVSARDEQRNGIRR